MTVYALDATRLRPMAALVAAHGATDFATPTWPLASNEDYYSHTEYERSY